MEEADKDWMMIRMVGGWVFLLVPAHPGSPGQRAVKQLLCYCCNCSLLSLNGRLVLVFSGKVMQYWAMFNTYWVDAS